MQDSTCCNHSKRPHDDRQRPIDDLDEEMDHYWPRYKRMEGRRTILHDMFIDNPIAKASMYLERPGCNSVAQKLAAWTGREYMAAFTAILDDDTVYTLGTLLTCVPTSCL